MNIYNIADLLTGLIESIMMLMLCETFCKEKNLSFGIYAIAAIAVAITIDVSNKILNNLADAAYFIGGKNMMTKALELHVKYICDYDKRKRAKQ